MRDLDNRADVPGLDGGLAYGLDRLTHILRSSRRRYIRLEILQQVGGSRRTLLWLTFLRSSHRDSWPSSPTLAARSREPRGGGGGRQRRSSSPDGGA